MEIGQEGNKQVALVLLLVLRLLYSFAQRVERNYRLGHILPIWMNNQSLLYTVSGAG